MSELTTTPKESIQYEDSEQENVPEIPGLELLNKLGFQISALPKEGSLQQEYRASKTVKAKSGEEHLIEVQIQPIVQLDNNDNRVVKAYACTFTANDFEYSHSGNDFTFNELVGSLRNLEAVAYFEKPIEKVPSHIDEYEERFFAKYRKFLDDK